ncbi:reprolysin-like metallopeptidase [Polaribacter sp.]|uniref:reprolysin-like metallopeptidase n=1 Tax=Polaribacter sp. TaxID=1920175 RepID=UPI0025FBD381|nr:zinc-dependent metalloprotease family protein [Polaribacter sp.]
MQKKLRNLTILTLLLLFVNQFSAQNFWSVSEQSKNSFQKKDVYQKEYFPTSYQLLNLKLTAFQKVLKKSSTQNKTLIYLPNKSGVLNRFLVRETSNFETALQLRFPEIKSYTAIGLDDSTAIAKISIGYDGLHAVISSKHEATTYIDPYSKDKNNYIVYSRLDLPKEEQDFQCLVEDNVKQVASEPIFNRLVNDGKLRTYRLAVVCSGEYAQFHINRQGIASSATDEDKKAVVLSAMNTSLTRINGVFEKDLGVKMVLVENNTNIIFLDANTDGITDGTANTMINEVQGICDLQIGTANYDIGHIFSIGGSGLAGLGVVCRDGQKARGVTGISSPVNDPYDIDYVVHEIGHQFGATHTQNNNCNRTNATAVEPGSGSTIMGYAGICNPNVLSVGDASGNSDDYFHTVSISQMQSIIQTTGSCATLTDTNNATPTANAGSDYTIPKSTPFKLTGEADDADGLGTLSYNWEQIDNEIGEIMPPAETNSGGPMFRSLPSKTVAYRHFPELAENSGVGGIGSSPWEVLPSVARELNFAFTVRDNNVGGGSTARDDVKITVADVAAFTVTSQASDVTWDVGSTQTISWTKSTTDIAPINCEFVNIRLSKDGGVTFPVVLLANTPNDGTQDIVIPNEVATNAKIMVEAVGNIFYNINSGVINVNSTEPTFIFTNTTGDLSACNVSEETVSYTLNLDFINNYSETVSFSSAGNPLNSQVSFTPETVSENGDVVVTILNFNDVNPINYTINVSATGGSVVQNLALSLDINSPPFSALTLSTPEDNKTDALIAPVLTWQEDDNATSYDIEISTTSNFSNIIASGSSNTNSFDSPALEQESVFYWRVKAKNSCGEGSFSDAYTFTTQSCTLCESIGTTEYATSTTLVKFNTINKFSSKYNDNLVLQGYFDYTEISTNVKKDDTHELTVNVNSDGNYKVLVKAWIDWNGDCVFNDTDEEYNLGLAANVTNVATDLSPLQITVPSNAKLGSTVMRVISKYSDPEENEFPTSCINGHDGETEDYTIIVEEATPSLDDVTFNKFNLFPNPNNGNFTLMFETFDTAKTKIELFDISGRSVAEKVFRDTSILFKEDISFNNLSKGLYLLKINNGNKQTIRKLVIE